MQRHVIWALLIVGTLALTLLAISGTGAAAATITQVNGTTCGTTIPGNWIPGQCILTSPYTVTSGNELEIPSGVAVFDDFYTLSVQSGGSLVIDNGGDYYAYSFFNSGTVTDSGTIYAEASDSMTNQNGGTITLVSGSLYVEPSDSMTNQNGGTITVASGGGLYVDGELENGGTITFEGGGGGYLYVNSDLENSGAITLASGGSFLFADGALNNDVGGVIYSYGTIYKDGSLSNLGNFVEGCGSTYNNQGGTFTGNPFISVSCPTTVTSTQTVTDTSTTVSFATSTLTTTGPTTTTTQTSTSVYTSTVTDTTVSISTTTQTITTTSVPPPSTTTVTSISTLPASTTTTTLTQPPSTVTVTQSLSTTTLTSTQTITSTSATTETSIQSTTTTAQPPSLTVLSVNQNGNAITGYFIVLYSSGGQQLNVGYTPKTFTGLVQGAKYMVGVSGFGSCTFSHWQDTGSSTDLRSFIATGAQTFTAVYNCRSGGSPAAPAGQHVGKGATSNTATDQLATLLLMIGIVASSMAVMSALFIKKRMSAARR